MFLDQLEWVAQRKNHADACVQYLICLQDMMKSTNPMKRRSMSAADFVLKPRPRTGGSTADIIAGFGEELYRQTQAEQHTRAVMYLGRRLTSLPVNCHRAISQPTPSHPCTPPPLDNRLSSGLVIASFQMEMPVASLLPGSSKQCTNYSLQGTEE